ncbi:hypothetical protein JDV02_007666 [Purpureocillium takamizusanense]|uniref:Uncharacterized protein n=1 Tax=Purpureocillium takamizusanense TaxID=2060973 RepID=A0A9Q8QL18_9HYPO|nr:uncharacterized protein JDV02_007666 [Purpureocillium takamizusanense]UNI21698.1 hypothetical protein JDV02_007666 [Purpureocillium takamizusanense]
MAKIKSVEPSKAVESVVSCVAVGPTPIVAGSPSVLCTSALTVTFLRFWMTAAPRTILSPVTRQQLALSPRLLM